MKFLSSALLSLTLASATAVAQDCAIPDTPDLPDGGSSTMEQMLEGQKTVKAFQEAATKYRECLDVKIAEATDAATADEATDADIAALRALEQQYNTSVSSEEALAEEFNTQIRTFKSVNPG
ncbi:MAG: hypothetical protein AAGA91_03225 [Pseudomonadota bacterium]